MAKMSAGIPSGQAQKMIVRIDGISQSKTGAWPDAVAVGVADGAAG